MSATQLEWVEHPDPPRRWVAAGVMARCGCGWRWWEVGSMREHQAEANERLEAHRREQHPYEDGS